MNKIKIIKFIFITIIYTLFAYAENEGWDVKLDIIKDKFLPAEPIIITIQATNNSNKEIRGFSATGHLFLDEKVCNQQHAVIEPATPPCPTCSGGTPKLYKPNENIIINIRLNYICYGLWVDNSVEASFGFHKFCYRDENRDICKNFEIIHPIGEDEGAYKWLQSNGIRDLYESNKLDYILDKYPTSTYAGWALYKLPTKELEGVFVVNENANKAILAAINNNSLEIKKLLHFSNDPNKEKERIDILKKNVNNVELFLKSHQEFLFSGYLMAREAFSLLILGELQKACYLMKKSLDLGWDLPQCSKECMKPYIEGTKNSIEILTKYNKCN